jgi:hypothetical protein
MFIVKAVKADDSYDLFEAPKVRVQESRVDGSNGPGQPPFIAADFEVFLDSDGPGKMLSVGNAQDHYAHVYVMNESGKTVDVVSWRYDQSIAPPIGRARRVA